MDWKTVKVPQGGRLFKIHNFTFMYKGVNYLLEVDEYADGTCSGHGEHSTDKNFIIESVAGKNVLQCLDELIQKIVARA